MAKDKSPTRKQLLDIIESDDLKHAILTQELLETE